MQNPNRQDPPRRDGGLRLEYRDERFADLPSSALTNRDRRLRSVRPLPFLGASREDLLRYDMSPSEFPELYRLVTARTGQDDWQIVAIGRGYNNVSVYGREIRIGLPILNRSSMDEVLSMVGHEVGHVWRGHGRDAPNGFFWPEADRRRHELEADIESACLNGIQPVIQTLRNHFSGARVADPNYPSMEERIANLQQFPNQNAVCRAAERTRTRR